MQNKEGLSEAMHLMPAGWRTRFRHHVPPACAFRLLDPQSRGDEKTFIRETRRRQADSRKVPSIFVKNPAKVSPRRAHAPYHVPGANSLGFLYFS